MYHTRSDLEPSYCAQKKGGIYPALFCRVTKRYPGDTECLSKLIHSIVFTARFQGSFTGKILLVIITKIRASHVLVPDAGNTLTNFLTLNAFNVAQHTLFTKVLLGQVIRRQCRGVIGRQRDQVVKNPSFPGLIGLEGTNSLIGLSSQLGIIVVNTHQPVTVIC